MGKNPKINNCRGYYYSIGKSKDDFNDEKYIGILCNCEAFEFWNIGIILMFQKKCTAGFAKRQNKLNTIVFSVKTKNN